MTHLTRITVGVAAAAAALVAALPSAAGPSAAACPGSRALTTVHTSAGAWSVRATSSVAGAVARYCISWTKGLDYSRTSAELQLVKSRFPAAPYGISYGARIDCPALHHAYGIVVASARRVEVELENGATVRASTIAPPRGLAKGLRFYVVSFPCGARPVELTGRNAAGRVVAHVALGRLMPTG